MVRILHGINFKIFMIIGKISVKIRVRNIIRSFGCFVDVRVIIQGFRRSGSCYYNIFIGLFLLCDSFNSLMLMFNLWSICKFTISKK